MRLLCPLSSASVLFRSGTIGPSQMIAAKSFRIDITDALHNPFTLYECAVGDLISGSK